MVQRTLSHSKTETQGTDLTGVQALFGDRSVADLGALRDLDGTVRTVLRGGGGQGITAAQDGAVFVVQRRGRVRQACRAGFVHCPQVTVYE